ncbi:MAG: tetratricopeptide repeat protein [Vicingaceae bacterium]
MKRNKLQQLYGILLLVSVLSYANTLSHDYVLDDFSVIKENFVVKQGMEALPTIFKTHYRHGYGYQSANLYRPIPLSLFALQWEIAPDNPTFAHAFNILFYALSICLLFYFLNLVWKGERPWLAFFTCFLFALHPIHTEVVANIKSIDELLSFAFVLISFSIWIKQLEKPDFKKKFLSLVFFTLAFFSKESTITFLAVLPLILILFRQFSWQKALQSTLPFLLPTLLYFISRIAVLGSLGGSKNIATIDNILVSADNPLIKLVSAIKILGLYLWKLVFPHPLMNDYSLQQIQLTSASDPWVWFSFLLYAALLYILYRSWKKVPVLAFGIGLFFISLSLYSNLFITIGTAFGERLLFVPSLGYCLVLAYLISQPFKSNFQIKNFWQSATTPLLIVLGIGAAYGFKTVDRNQAWKDNYTLYATDVENCNRSARCHYYYGIGLMKEKALNTADEAQKRQLIQESIKAFDRALGLYPSYSDAYGQRGLAYYRLQEYQAALSDYQNATRFNPGNANAWSNMGTLFFQMKQYQEAKQSFQKALRANPNHVDALANYGSTLGTLGEYNSAITYFKKAVALKPNEASYYQMIGMTYQNMGRKDLAGPYLQKAQQLQR